jgi:HlyD family type I secretion membrane fusion protein
MTSPAELTESDQAEAGEMMRREAQLFASRRADRQHSVRLIREQASQQQATIGKYSAQIDATERQLKLIEDELVGLQKLYSKGLVTKNRVNSSERAAIQLEATRASLQANIFEARARVAAAQQQAADIERNLRDRIESELTDVTRDLAEQTNRLRSSKNDATRGVITAPISGTVEQLAYRTRGSAIPSGAPIMTIVPTNQIRQIEAPITPGDIDLIHIGQNVRMILSTSGETARTELRGTVSYVASASVLDERTGAHSYTVRIKPDAHAASQIKALRYGTPVEAYFVTKDRSMLSYLLRPLTEQLERAFKR